MTTQRRSWWWWIELRTCDRGPWSWFLDRILLRVGRSCPLLHYWSAWLRGLCSRLIVWGHAVMGVVGLVLSSWTEKAHRRPGYHLQSIRTSFYFYKKHFSHHISLVRALVSLCLPLSLSLFLLKMECSTLKCDFQSYCGGKLLFFALLFFFFFPSLLSWPFHPPTNSSRQTHVLFKGAVKHTRLSPNTHSVGRLLNSSNFVLFLLQLMKIGWLWRCH